MVPPQIPLQVLRFIEERIDTVPQLETLLMMSEEPTRSWTAAEVASRTYVSSSDAVRVLEALHRRALISAAEHGAAFRISIADDQQRRLLADVSAAYRSNLTRIATFIHEKPPASLKEFARAFDLKKDR